MQKVLNLHERKVKRGDIFYANFKKGVGSEQNGRRPCVVIQNDKGNEYGSTTIVALITKVNSSAHLPVHVPISKKESMLPYDSVILTEQIRTIDKRRLDTKISTLSDDTMNKVSLALAVSILSETGNPINQIEICDKYQDIFIA